MPASSVENYEREMSRLISRLLGYIRQINRRSDLTDQDKTRLKEYLLEHFLTPRARRLVTTHFPQE
jgi:hypothetical protein